MDIRELRDERLYDEFMETFQAIFHLILCEKCRNMSCLELQNDEMEAGRFLCGKPATIPKHSEICELEDCELCAEFLQHSDADLTVQDICNRMVRFIEKHTGSETTLAVPRTRSSFGPPELVANFKSVALDGITPMVRADPETLDGQMKKCIKGYDALRYNIFSILHSLYCKKCRRQIDQGDRILRSGKLYCDQPVGHPNHLAECIGFFRCGKCEPAESCSDKTLTGFGICNGLIRFVEIYAGVPPEKRLKAPPGRLFFPNTAASFKTTEKVESEANKAECTVKPVEIVVENSADKKSGAVPKTNQWLVISILIVLLVISLFFNLLALKNEVIDNSKTAEPL